MDAGSPKTRAPKLQVRNRTDSSGIDVPPTEHPTGTNANTARPSLTSSTDRPSSDHSHSFWTPEGASSKSSTSISGTNKPKSKNNLFRLLSLKEPSASAWEQFAQQQKAEAALRGNNAVGISYKKLPGEVPKVNSKWDGMPKVASEKKGTSPSVKRNTDDHAWASPVSSTRQSSSSKGSTDRHIPHTHNSSSSTLRATRSHGHGYFDQPPRTPDTASRSQGRSHGTMAWSTRSLTPDEPGPAEWTTFSDMPVDRPRQIEPDEEEAVAPGLAESVDVSEPSLTSSLPTNIGSDDSSPAEPRTPDDESDLHPSDGPKKAPPPAYSPRNVPSSDVGRAWSQTADVQPGVPPPHAVPPPPIPDRSTRRTSSAQSLRSGRNDPASNIVERQLDGVDNSVPQAREVQAPPCRPEVSSADEHERSIQVPPPVEAKPLDAEKTDELDAMDDRRSRPASQTTTRPHLNFSRPGSTGRPSIDSTPSTPTSPSSTDSTRTPFRSFSRPLPFNPVPAASNPRPTSASSSHSARKSASPMGMPSIVRNNMPIYSSTGSGFIAPRFQPGRAIVKDSDLDTIAETDSLCSRRSYASTIGFDMDIPRRRGPGPDYIANRDSYASTIDADIPRRRAAIPDTDGASDDMVEDDSDIETPRTSVDYASSESTLDVDVPPFPARSSEPANSTIDPVDTSSSHSAFKDDKVNAGSDSDTDTEPSNAAVRQPELRQEHSARSLAPSVASATSALSARWSKTPQERLGLGVRKSVLLMPWDEQVHAASRPASGASGAASKVFVDTHEGFDRGGEKGINAGDVRNLLKMFRKG